MAYNASRSTGNPARSTGSSARVAGVIAASRRFRSILRVSGSTSTNLGVAPTARMTLLVATHDRGVVMTLVSGTHTRNPQPNFHGGGAGIEGTNRSAAKVLA